MLIRSSDLSKSDKLLLKRRREGLTQPQMAKKMRTNVVKYREWESGQNMKGSPRVTLGKLTANERCFFMRKREKMSLNELASELELCRWWVSQMERGEAPVDKLVEYWES